MLEVEGILNSNAVIVPQFLKSAEWFTLLDGNDVLVKIENFSVVPEEFLP